MNAARPAPRRRACWPPLALACCCIGFAAAAQNRQPYTPADDAAVLEHVAPPRAPGVLQLREARAQWQAEPQNYALALAYARVAVELGRQEDDPRYFGYAESALRPWLERPEAPPDARLLRASLRQARKDFAGAAEDLDALVAGAGPEAAQARLARANLRLLQGQPAAALEDCTALAGRVDALLLLACRAAAQSLLGKAAESLKSLEGASAQLPQAPLSLQAWCLAIAAGAAERLGRSAEARDSYARAQRLLQSAGTRDPGLLAAYADFLLEQNDAAAVPALLSSTGRIDSLLLRLALAERRLGQAGDAADAAAAQQHAEVLAERFAEARQRGDSLHLREEALFQLSLRQDAPAALELALRNWQAQREPIDARILLRAAIAAGRPQAAQPVLLWMRQTGVEDVYLQPLAQRIGDSQ